MQVQLARWGNSFGMRIPKSLANRLGLKEGSQVELAADGNRIVISLARPSYRLADLVVGLDRDDLRDTFDWGMDEGREALE